MSTEEYYLHIVKAMHAYLAGTDNDERRLALHVAIHDAIRAAQADAYQRAADLCDEEAQTCRREARRHVGTGAEAELRAIVDALKAAAAFIRKLKETP